MRGRVQVTVRRCSLSIWNCGCTGRPVVYALSVWPRRPRVSLAEVALSSCMISPDSHTDGGLPKCVSCQRRRPSFLLKSKFVTQ